MNSDYYIDQGYSHRICEDYVSVGDNFAIISDGCSSSEHTDIGARVLCMSARELLTRYLRTCAKEHVEINYNFFRTYVMARSMSVIQPLGIPSTSLDATLIVAFVRNGCLTVYIYGDGYVSIKYKNGEQVFHKYEFKDNSPYYPIYSIDYDRDRIYRKEVGESFKSCLGKNGTVWKVFNGNINTDEIVWENTDKISSVIIATDGMGSFLEKKDGAVAPVSDIEIMTELTNFKGTKGEFVNRRGTACMKRFLRNGIKHYDDLAIGGINLP